MLLLPHALPHPSDQVATVVPTGQALMLNDRRLVLAVRAKA